MREERRRKRVTNSPSQFKSLFVAECTFGKQIRELGSTWFADLGPPFGVMYCIKCECIPVRIKVGVPPRAHSCLPVRVCADPSPFPARPLTLSPHVPTQHYVSCVTGRSDATFTEFTSIIRCTYNGTPSFSVTRARFKIQQ